MSGSSNNTIADFLVAISYQETGRQQVNQSVNKLLADLSHLGNVAKDAAQVFRGALTAMASAMDDLYFASARTRSSVESIRAIGFAASQMGSSAASALSSLEGLGRFVRNNPAGESFIQTLGVNTRTTSGQLRDMGAVYADVITKLHGMPGYQQEAYGGILGISPRDILAGGAAMAQYTAQYRSMLAAAGLDSQKAAKDANFFMTEVRTLGGAFGILQDKVASLLTRAMGNDIRRFREGLVSNFGTISAVLVTIARGFLAASEVVMTMAKRLIDASRDIGEWFGNLSTSSQRLIEFLGGILIAWRVLSLGILGSPLGIALAALGGAFLLLYDDYKVWAEGGAALFDWGKWIPEIKGVWTEVQHLGGVIKDELGPAFDAFLAGIVPAITAFFKHDIPEMIHSSIAALETLVSWLTHAAELFQAVRSGDIGAITAASKALLGDYGIKGADKEAGKDSFSDNAIGRMMRQAFGLFGRGEQNGEGTPGSRFAGRLGNLFSSGQTGGNPGAGLRMDKRAAAKEAYDFWTNKGFTPAGAGAMVAAEQHESSFDPRARGDADASGAYKAFGLYQHHSDRIDKIQRATGINMRTASAAEQREGMYQEMALGLDAKSGAAFARIKNARSAQEASDLNVDQVERPLDRSGNKVTRGAIATDVMRKLGGADARPAIGLSQIEALRGLPPGALRGLDSPQPLMGGSNDNSTTHAPTLNQNTTIHVQGAGADTAQRVMDGQRSTNQNAIRALSGSAR